MSGQGGFHAALARLVHDRARVLGFRSAEPLILRLRHGWCLGCAVTQAAGQGPRLQCACAGTVHARQVAAQPYRGASAERVRLGWCLHHAHDLPVDGRTRPSDCSACRSGLPDLAGLMAEASASGFWARYPLPAPAPDSAASAAKSSGRKARQSADCLRDTGPEVARGHAPLDLLAQRVGLHPDAGLIAWREVCALRLQLRDVQQDARRWRRARDLLAYADKLALALTDRITEAQALSLSTDDADAASCVRLMLARQFLPDCPDWPQCWPVLDWLRFVPPDLWPLVRAGWLSLADFRNRDAPAHLREFAAVTVAAYVGAPDPWTLTTSHQLRAIGASGALFGHLRHYAPSDGRA